MFASNLVKTLTIFSILMLFGVVSLISLSPAAFADHSEVTIEAAIGSGAPGCETTAEGCYIPSTATVDVGGVVIMSNPDTAAHTFTAGSPSDGPSGEFDTSLLMAGNSFEWSPDTVGEIPYFCMVHPWMVGTIIVQEVESEETVEEETHMEETVEEETHMEETVEEETHMEETVEEENNPAIDMINIGSTALYVELIDDKVYVTNPVDGNISIIDTNSNQIVGTIDTPQGVLIIEKVLDKNKIYVTADDQNKVFVYDLETNEKLNEIDLGEPEITLFSKSDKPYGQREYTSFQTNGIGLEYNPNNEMLYAAHSQVNHVNVIDTNQDVVIDTIPVGKSPILIEIDEMTNTAYVTNWESNDVTVIDTDTNEVVSDLNTGYIPDQMAIDTENRRLYVTHHASPHVSIIDVRDNTIEGEIKLKGPTHAIAVDTKNDLLHVTYTPDSPFTGTATLNQVEFIDTNTNEIVGSFELEDNPFVLKIHSEDQKLYATIIKQGVVVAVDLAADEEYQKILALQTEEQMQASSTDDNEESTEPGGGCLIATAAYGTELAPQVQFLREIRDTTVMSTVSGTSFMTGFNQFYYSFSPTIADMQRENPMFQETVRALITPMISTLSILTLAEEGNEFEVFGLGASVIALNLGMYVAAPAAVGFAVSKQLKVLSALRQ